MSSEYKAKQNHSPLPCVVPKAIWSLPSPDAIADRRGTGTEWKSQNILFLTVVVSYETNPTPKCILFSFRWHHAFSGSAAPLYSLPSEKRLWVAPEGRAGPIFSHSLDIFNNFRCVGWSDDDHVHGGLHRKHDDDGDVTTMTLTNRYVDDVDICWVGDDDDG